MEKKDDRYNDKFPTILRKLMEANPETGDKTTQKELGDALGIRPQTVSLYMKGETQPTQETLCKMAQYFDVSLDYLLTGVSAENHDLNRDFGLSEDVIRYMSAVYDFGADENGEDIMPLLNTVLADSEFYKVLAKIKIGCKKIEADSSEETKEFQMWSMERAVSKYIEGLLQGTKLNW